MYRDTGRHIIGGVCSGLGKYLGVDPVIMRILFILLTFLGGGGVLIYLILWIVIPEYPVQQYYNTQDHGFRGNDGTSDEDLYEQCDFDDQEVENDDVGSGKGRLIGGVILIVIGLLFLIGKYIPRVYFEDFWPLILIVVGVIFLVDYYNKKRD